MLNRKVRCSAAKLLHWQNGLSDCVVHKNKNARNICTVRILSAAQKGLLWSLLSARTPFYTLLRENKVFSTNSSSLGGILPRLEAPSVPTHIHALHSSTRHEPGLRTSRDGADAQPQVSSVLRVRTPRKKSQLKRKNHVILNFAKKKKKSWYHHHDETMRIIPVWFLCAIPSLFCTKVPPSYPHYTSSIYFCNNLQQKKTVVSYSDCRVCFTSCRDCIVGIAARHRIHIFPSPPFIFLFRYYYTGDKKK